MLNTYLVISVARRPEFTLNEHAVVLGTQQAGVEGVSNNRVARLPVFFIIVLDFFLAQIELDFIFAVPTLTTFNLVTVLALLEFESSDILWHRWY